VLFLFEPKFPIIEDRQPAGKFRLLPCVAFSSSLLNLESNLRAWARASLREEGQSIAEYSTMLSIILVLALGLVRLFETNAFQLLVQIAKSIK
jgi:hypothetical protein